MPSFATYLHPHTCYTSTPIEQIRFIGHSYPHFSQVRAGLEERLADYPKLAVREATYEDYLTVHTVIYLDKLRKMAAGESVDDPPRW
jgi:hypothetical protein